MKRSELQVGQQYALMSPSQDVGGYREAKQVEVYSTEAKYKSSYRGWNSNDKPRAVKFDGKSVIADDRTYKVGPHAVFGEKDAARLVAVVEKKTTTWEGEVAYTLHAVPLSQLRMPWAEYKSKRATAERQRRREREADNARYDAAEVVRKSNLVFASKLNKLLEEGGGGRLLKAKMHDGEVVLSGPHADLLALVDLVNGEA